MGQIINIGGQLVEMRLPRQASIPQEYWATDLGNHGYVSKTSSTTGWNVGLPTRETFQEGPMTALHDMLILSGNVVSTCTNPAMQLNFDAPVKINTIWIDLSKTSNPANYPLQFTHNSFSTSIVDLNALTQTTYNTYRKYELSEALTSDYFEFRQLMSILSGPYTKSIALMYDPNGAQ